MSKTTEQNNQNLNMPKQNSQNLNLDIPKLTGKNYLNWRSIISDVIALRDLEKAVYENDGNKIQNLQAKILIKSSLDEAHLAEIRKYDTAFDIWNHLSRMCIGANSSDVAMLVRKFYNFSHVPGDSMSTHLEKLSTMREQLIAIEQGPTDEVFIDRILQTLPAEFNKLRENWDYLHNDQKTLNELKSRILKIEEDNKTKEPKVEPDAQVYIASELNKQFRNMSIDEKKKVTRCGKCGHKGHWAKECRTKPENYVKQQSQKQTSQPNKSKIRSPKDIDPSGVIFTAVVAPQKVDLNQERFTAAKAFKVSNLDQSLKNQWIADTGASNHICNNKSWFSKIQPFDIPKKVTVGDNSETKALGEGTIEIVSKVNDQEIKAKLENVIYAPGIATNLFSIGQASRRGMSATFSENEVKLTKNNLILAMGDRMRNNLYIMNIKADRAINDIALYCQPKRTLNEWHRTLGHASKTRLINLIDDEAIQITATDKDAELECPDCPPGKGRHASHPSLSRRAEDIGHRVFVDLAGPIEFSVHGNRYFLLCKDEFSTYTYVYCLKDKAHTYLALAKLIAEFEVETGHRIKRIHSDKGSEFFGNNKVETLFAIEHIVHETSAVYTPQQNGMIEREIQSVVGMARTMILASDLPIGLWDEAIKTACFIRNRLPNKATNITPFEVMTKRKPKVAHLCEFGKQVHIIIDGHHLTKFEPRTEQGFIVGFTMRSNTYRVYLEKSSRVIETCNVIMKPHKPQTTEAKATRYADTFEPLTSDNSNSKSRTVLDDYFNNLTQNGGAFDDIYHDASNCEQTVDSINHQTSEDRENSNNDPTTPDAGDEEVPSPAFSPLSQHANDSLSTVSQGETSHALLVTAEIIEPLSYSEAISTNEKQNWLEAINEEFRAHELNGTWITVDRPPNKPLMTTKWIFKLKTKVNGDIERYKARVVARGYEQKHGRDFFETFAPVARYDSIRALVAIAAYQDLIYIQFDVQTAFLYGILEEEIYIHPPEGMNIEPNKALKLIKGLYGLKQSPRVWSNKFKEEIQKIGFQAIKTDNCVFKHKQNNIYLCIYVDDGLIFGKHDQELQQIITHLKKVFSIRVMQDSTFVGLEIERTSNGYFIHQASFAKKILERFNMQDSSPVTTPLMTGHKLTEPDNNDTSVECQYREAIGSLLYLAANSRPDLLHAVTMLAKFCSDPKEKHWQAIKRVMRYIKGSMSKGIQFEKQSRLPIDVYTDADHASDVGNRKSITGTIILMSKGPVIFRSTQQSLVAASTTEAEFIAAAEAVRDLIWLKQFLKELGVEHEKMILKCDSTTAIRLIKNPEFPRRTKHIDIKFHFIRDYMNQGSFELKHVSSEEQVADYLTKAIGREQFKRLIELSNLVDNPNSRVKDSSERGGVLDIRSSRADKVAVQDKISALPTGIMAPAGRMSRNRVNECLYKSNVTLNKQFS